MIIAHRYSAEREEDSGIVRIRGLDAPLCPKCGVLMSGYDTRLRRAVSGNGATHSYRLRRLRCPSCGSIHLELPDFLRAGKHYEAAVIDEVLSGNSDSCPAENSTIWRWKRQNHPPVLQCFSGSDTLNLEYLNAEEGYKNEEV
jgi:ribosomal protein S27AE